MGSYSCECQANRLGLAEPALPATRNLTFQRLDLAAPMGGARRVFQHRPGLYRVPIGAYKRMEGVPSFVWLDPE